MRVRIAQEAARLMAELDAIAEDLRNHGDPHSPFEPPYGTLTIGMVRGGTAVNILARECTFVWDLRLTPGDDRAAIEARFARTVEQVQADMRKTAPEARIEAECLSAAPPLRPEPQSAAEHIARLLTGDNQTRVVSYGTEAGLFQQAGMAAVVCGPGSIDQAHKADEYVSLEQLAQCLRTLQNLPAVLSA